MICEDKNYINIDNHIDLVLRKNIYDKRINKVNVCPRCKSNKYIKYGTFKGIQRFRCKECGKTFSLVTYSIWSYSKKKPDKWFKFIELILEKKVLRECAEILDININTAFAWRHKVLNELVNINSLVTLNGTVHMIKTCVKENFKGNKNIKTDVREKVIVVSAKGDRDTMLSIPLCKTLWNWHAFESKILNRITERSHIVPYVDRYIFIAARRYNKNIVKNVRKDNNLIKNFKSISKRWFRVFKGVATKYLLEYLSWFILFYRDECFTDVDVLYKIV